ncbi:MAG TPA: hypothetical protein VN605_06630 [Thermoanaerobaculia bacterium]|nr:hypothetical protein [Thermoanaerobaculia bacterium]
MKLDLIRDMLDKQLVDRSGISMGRADGVVIALRDGEQPVVDHLQLGAEVLAHRLGRLALRLVKWMRRRFPVREEAVLVVRWPSIAEITSHHLKLDLDAEQTSAFAWERWLRDHVVARMSGPSK